MVAHVSVWERLNADSRKRHDMAQQHARHQRLNDLPHSCKVQELHASPWLRGSSERRQAALVARDLLLASHSTLTEDEQRELELLMQSRAKESIGAADTQWTGGWHAAASTRQTDCLTAHPRVAPRQRPRSSARGRGR